MKSKNNEFQKITIVVPCYNEEAVLPYFFSEIGRVIDGMTANSEILFELIFIDDGSTDQTLNLLREFTSKDERVRYISFSRNFGKEAAIYAGLKNAKGDYIAVMDADMQDPPSLLPQMYALLQNEKYDCIATRRVTRKGEPPIRSFFARNFYRLINKLSDANIVDGARDFRLMKRIMVDAIISMGEYNRFSKGIFGWVGFRTKWLPYENVERVAGETKWSFWKLFLYGIQGIVAFSTAPLTIALIFGILICAVAAFLILYNVFNKSMLLDNPLGGWSSLVSFLMLMGGIQLVCIGILGQYLAKTYLEVKHRPIYIVAETEREKDERKIVR